MAQKFRKKKLADLAQVTIGWAALILVLVSAIPLGGVVPVVWTLLSVMVLGLFAVQVLIDLLRGVGKRAARLWPAAVLFLGAVGYAAVQVALPAPGALAHPVWQLAPQGASPRISADPGQGQLVVLRLLTYAMLFWIIARAARKRARARRMLTAIALWSTGVAAFGIYVFATGDNPIVGDTRRGGPLSATFVNRNSYATYAAFGVLANLALFFDPLLKLRRLDGRVLLRDFLDSFFKLGWVFLLGALVCLAALALTKSRAGGIAGVFGIAVMLAALGRSGARGGARGGVLLWILPLAGIGFILLTTTSGVVARFLSRGTDDLRFAVYPEIVAGIMERPWLGQGAGAFQDTFRARVPLDAAVGEWDLAHSSYLENAYELGLPAAAALYLALGLIGLRLLRGVRNPDTAEALPACALGCFATAALHAAFDFSLQIPAVTALFCALLAIGWTQSFGMDELRREASARLPDPTEEDGAAVARLHDTQASERPRPAVVPDPR